MQVKEITVVLYGRRHSRADWNFELDEKALEAMLRNLAEELVPFGIKLRHARDEEMVLEIKGYGDLLNTVRIRSPQDAIGNLCLGHIIGVSPNRDLLEDIRRGVNRVAFAPETIEPEGSNKIVCHNCGCGC
ncbi:MAG TPA: hypothetical protein VIA07_07585 [Desulfuromonadales bacterium]|jgi:hypothetical protein